jgi:hypothetical protein
MDESNGHKKSTTAESSPTFNHDHGSEGVKVSAPDGVGDNGINSRASTPEDPENPIIEKEFVQAEAASGWSTSQENGSMAVKIDWEAVDWNASNKEVDDFLGSDDEDEDEDDSNTVGDSEVVDGDAR